jgi:hypothetical protein
MEREINSQQEKWQDLVETKDFNELSQEEQRLVLNIATQSAYELARKSVLAMQEEVDLIPRPLILEEKKKGLIAPIPLYQALLATAAAFVLGFLLIESGNTITVLEGKPSLAEIDTVYIEKKTTDTVVQIERDYVDRYIVRNVAGLDRADDVVKKESNSSVFAGAGPSLPKLASMDLENKGTAASNDNSFALVEGFLRSRNQD